MTEPVRNASALISPQVRSFGPKNYQGALPGWIEDVIYPQAALPVWPYLWLGLCTGTLASVIARRRWLHPGWLVGAGAVLLAYPHAALVYHGDVMELARHAIGVAVQARIGVWLVLVFALDGLISARVETYLSTPNQTAQPGRGRYGRRWNLGKLLGRRALPGAFLAVALLTVSALEGLWIANHYPAPVYGLAAMLLITLCLGIAMIWIYRKPVVIERVLEWLSPEESNARLYWTSLGLLGLTGLCILTLGLFSPAWVEAVSQALSVSTRLARLYGTAQALLQPLRPGAAWLGLMAAQALGALLVVFWPFYQRLWRAAEVYRLAAAIGVIALGLGQMVLLYLRLPGLQAINGWRYPYQALEVGRSGQLVFLGLLALAVVGALFLSAKPGSTARNAWVVSGLWLALGIGFIFLTVQGGASGIRADGLVRGMALPMAGLALLGLILTSIGLETPLAPLLMLTAPVFLLSSLRGPFEINRFGLLFVGVMALWLVDQARRRSAGWAALGAGFLLGAGTALAAPIAALFVMLVVWIWLDAGVQTKRDLRRTAILTGALAGGAGVGFLLAILMGNQPLSSYLASLASARQELGLHLGLYAWLVRAKLDPFELAFLAGLPMAGLAGLRALQAGWDLIQKQANRLDTFALAFAAAGATLVLVLPPFGGSAQAWLFLLPGLAILAADEMQQLFPGRWVGFVVGAQLVICFLVFRFLG